ncbi:MAG TPA: glycosyltransferase, partial [Longimicrobiaceae bacterium]|nr:glycosyltransferase [Longimicrobiaceae bacterium]
MTEPRDARRRTILHLIDMAGPGGAETILFNLATGLPRERWRPVVAVSEAGWLSQALQPEGIDPLMVAPQRAFDLPYLRALLGVVRRHRVELIHAHLLGPSVYGSLAGRLSGVPVVCTFHGQADVAPDESHRAAKFRIIDRRKNRVVFVSESLRRSVLGENRLDPARTRVIHNGIDARTFRPGSDSELRRELGIRPGEVLVGAVGNLRTAKAYPDLLQAAALLRQRSEMYRFVIVGDNRGRMYQDLLALRDRLGLRDSVHFAGFRDDVPRIMNNLDIYAISSHTEGFSLSTVQALACGVPTVATRCGGPEEIVEDGVSGVLVPTRDPAALAGAIHDLAGDPDRRARLARAGRAQVEERFSTEAMVASYQAVYE